MRCHVRGCRSLALHARRLVNLNVRWDVTLRSVLLVRVSGKVPISFLICGCACNREGDDLVKMDGYASEGVERRPDNGGSQERVASVP